MSLTVTQSKVLSALLTELARSIKGTQCPETQTVFTTQQVIADIIYELGPFLGPMLADGIASRPTQPLMVHGENKAKIVALIESANEELQQSLNTLQAPGAAWREIIAQLIQEMAPMILQIIVSMLLSEEEAKQ